MRAIAVEHTDIPTRTRELSVQQLQQCLPELVALLCDTVDAGASLGFLPPLSSDESRRYWLSLRAQIEAGARSVFASFCADRLVASGQLALPPWPNARHRAEIQKVCVARELRGRGIGHSLMRAMHAAAADRGRTLLLLSTRSGGPAESFYESLGYRTVGVVPGYSAGAEGERYDALTMFKRLDEGSA